MLKLLVNLIILNNIIKRKLKKKSGLGSQVVYLGDIKNYKLHTTADEGLIAKGQLYKYFDHKS
jgi:hypothetical protein